MQTRMPLSKVYDFLDSLRIEKVMFALSKPVIPSAYANPFIRLITVPDDGVYCIRAVLDNEIREFCLKRGDLLCCLPDSCVQRIDSPENSPLSVVFKQYCIRFVCTPSDPGRRNYFYHSEHSLSPGGHFLLRGLLAFARENRPQTMLISVAESLFDAIRSDLDRDQTCESKAARTYREALQLMQSRFQSDVSRDDIAAALEITPTHLSRLFKQLGVKGFNETLTRMRLEHAAELLGDNKLSLDTIATQSGFQSASYFIKVYKKYHGTTPRH